MQNKISKLISDQILLETKSGSIELSTDKSGKFYIGAYKEPGTRHILTIDPIANCVTIPCLNVLGTISASYYVGVSGAGGSGSPGAPDTSVQFNNLGNFAGSANLTYDSAAARLTGIQASFTHITGSLVGNATTVTNGIYTTTISSNATTGVTAGAGLTGGGTVGALTVNVGAGDGVTVNANDIAVDSTVARTTGTQTIGGAKTFSSYITGSITGSDAKFTSITGSHAGSGAGLTNITSSGITNFTSDVRSQFSAGNNITIISGTISAATGSGTGSPGGVNQTIQFNSGSQFSGSSNLIFNIATSTLSGTLSQFTTVTASNIQVSNRVSTQTITITGTASLSAIADQAYINYNSSSNRVEILPGLFIRGNVETTGSVSASIAQFTTISASNYFGLPSSDLFRLTVTSSVQLNNVQCSIFAKNTVSSSFTITLPSCVTAQAKEYYFIKADSLSGSVTVQGSGSNLINGNGSFLLNGPYQSVTLITDGISDWFIF
jgi:hypothetical protein